MFTGVTAGSIAFAETDEYYEQLENQLEDFCDMTNDEQLDFFTNNPDMAVYDERLTSICAIEDFDMQIDAIYELIDEIIPETRDDVADDFEDIIEDFEDCVEAGNPIMESYPEQCMTADGTVFVNDEQVDDYNDDYDDDRYADGDKFYVCHNGKNTISVAESAVRAHLSHGDSMKKCSDAVRDSDRDYDDKMHDKYSNKGPGNLRDHFAMYCDMTPEEREEKMQMHDDLPEDLRADMARYCEMTDDEQDNFRDSMMDRMDMLKDHMKDKMRTDKDMRHSLEKYCEMSKDDRAA